MAPAAPPLQAGRALYPFLLPIQTRWMDNDIYGHVNNVVYYSYFDTVINHYLIQHAGLDIHAGPQIGLCVESHCRYAAPLAFPQTVEAGLRVETLGRSSVRYGIGLFGPTGADPAAYGWFVHVFVDRDSRKPLPIGDQIRAALQRIAVQADGPP
jgi:acyl-CoA thioester hydrolase